MKPKVSQNTLQSLLQERAISPKQMQNAVQQKLSFAAMNKHSDCCHNFTSLSSFFTVHLVRERTVLFLQPCFCCFCFLPLHKYATNQVDDAFSSAGNQWQLWFSVQYSITVLFTLLDFKLQISNIVVGFEIRVATVSRRTASGYHEGNKHFLPKTFPYH